MIVLAYLWLLAVIPLLVEKQDPEVQWHAKHGIVLMIAELAALFAYMLLTSIVTVAAFGLGCAFGIFAMVPSWWRHRRLSRNRMRRASDKLVVAAPAPAVAETTELHPPRDGL